MTNRLPLPKRIGLSKAVGRGFACRCPHCGRGNIFNRYLRPTHACPVCGEAFDGIRTDDIAPYFTILVVGHIVIPLLLLVEQLAAPPLWVHGLVWPMLALLVSLLALPRIKGAVLSWMWWLGMRGDEQH